MRRGWGRGRESGGRGSGGRGESRKGIGDREWVEEVVGGNGGDVERDRGLEKCVCVCVGGGGGRGKEEGAMPKGILSRTVLFLPIEDVGIRSAH